MLLVSHINDLIWFYNKKLLLSRTFHPVRRPWQPRSPSRTVPAICKRAEPMNWNLNACYGTYLAYVSFPKMVAKFWSNSKHYSQITVPKYKARGFSSLKDNDAFSAPPKTEKVLPQPCLILQCKVKTSTLARTGDQRSECMFPLGKFEESNEPTSY